MTIIVAGHLVVDAIDRAAYLDGWVDITRAARAAPGSFDVALGPDRLDDTRSNVFDAR